MKNISFPNHWETPKYHLGQTVKQGRILGVEYFPPGSMMAHRYGKGWIYWVLINEFSGEADSFDETQIQPLAAEELLAEIDFQKTQIKIRENNIETLLQQIRLQ